MFDYSLQIDAFRDKRIRLSSTFKDKLLSHRVANRKRLISRLSNYISRTQIGESNFKPQGSVAMGTVIQTKFVDEEYDIDDGLVIPRSQLKNGHGQEMTSDEVREAVRQALEDQRFNRKPQLFTNCIRVFYADRDEEKHHVDFPVYRNWSDDKGTTIRELASEAEWVESDPTQVNSWFEGVVKDRNANTKGWGTQFRHLIQLLKRFCRSRKDWLDLLPNGMKLTMLVAECQPPYESRIDLAFRQLLENLKNRLVYSKVIENLAHPDKPIITRGNYDANVDQLLKKVSEALVQIESLDEIGNDNEEAARKVWDWVFKSDGFFKEYDEATKTNLASRFDVPWRDALTWNVVEQYSLSIAGKWGNNKDGLTWQEFPNDGPSISKHLYLRFHGNTNTPKPYQVFWQVVNTGSEALAAGCYRGEITASTSVGAGGLHSTTAAPLREERTLYTGMHWIECFIVKDGICVAKSGPFVINIE
jgi:Adenylyl/Guanylyl and SMODS C-terminal sensor domain